MPKILAVDDEPHIVALLEKFLALKGFEVTGATDGESALKIIESGEKIDLMILDLKMPNISGIDVLKKMQAMNKKIEVLIFSGCPTVTGRDYEDLNKMGYNPNEVLSKPMDLFGLVEIINKRLSKK